jgi:mRNA interferase RelE/StbE
VTEQDIYSVELSDRAKKALKRLDKETTIRILARLDELVQNAETASHYALRGELKGYFRERVGDYRIIFLIDHAIRLIMVEAIGHRRDVYGKLRRAK